MWAYPYLASSLCLSHLMLCSIQQDLVSKTPYLAAASKLATIETGKV